MHRRAEELHEEHIVKSRKADKEVEERHFHVVAKEVRKRMQGLEIYRHQTLFTREVRQTES